MIITRIRVLHSQFVTGALRMSSVHTMLSSKEGVVSALVWMSSSLCVRESKYCDRCFEQCRWESVQFFYRHPSSLPTAFALRFLPRNQRPVNSHIHQDSFFASSVCISDSKTGKVKSQDRFGCTFKITIWGIILCATVVMQERDQQQVKFCNHKTPTKKHDINEPLICDTSTTWSTHSQSTCHSNNDQNQASQWNHDALFTNQPTLEKTSIYSSKTNRLERPAVILRTACQM